MQENWSTVVIRRYAVELKLVGYHEWIGDMGGLMRGTVACGARDIFTVSLDCIILQSRYAKTGQPGRTVCHVRRKPL
jgi:hypothetical protein